MTTTLTLTLPAAITVPLAARSGSDAAVTIHPHHIAPDVAADLFVLGLTYAIRNNTGGGNLAVAYERADRLNSGQDWRDRHRGTTTNEIAAAARDLALAAVRAAKPAGIKMQAWLSLPAVKAKIAEIAARPETIAAAEAAVAARRAAAAHVTVDLGASAVGASAVNN